MGQKLIPRNESSILHARLYPNLWGRFFPGIRTTGPRIKCLELALLLLLLVFGVGCGWMVPPFLYVAWIDRLL